MEKDDAKKLVSASEFKRWQDSVVQGQAVVKPRVFVLADLRQNAAVSTIAGPLDVPANFTNAPPQWAFFADDMPNANWEHPCRYLIVYKDSSIQTVNSRFPPDSNDNAPIEEVFPFPV